MQVQHVGPKLALAILSVLAPEKLVAAISRGDVNQTAAETPSRTTQMVILRA